MEAEPIAMNLKVFKKIKKASPAKICRRENVKCAQALFTQVMINSVINYLYCYSDIFDEQPAWPSPHSWRH
jgi:hypothetical protein